MFSNTEEHFPRGGKKPKAPVKRVREDDNLFSVNKQPKQKKSKKNKRSNKESLSNESFIASIKIQGSLSYNKIQDGMTILGCVRHITNFSLEVELPGLCHSYINITRISDPFVTSLNDQLAKNDAESDSILRKMFQMGQFLPVKVINIDNNEKGVRIEGTINPKHINDGKHHTSFKKGMLIWASIQSVSDHGYEINVGVKNCRAFLPFKNVDSGKTLNVGEPVWCAVHRSDCTNVATTLRVSIRKDHIQAVKIEEIESLDDLLPGMQIEFLSEKITPNGIQGKFLNNYLGYIDEAFLKNPLKTLEHYQEGKLMSAYVLYTEPALKITHLSMRNTDTVPPPNRSNGDFITAQVSSKTHNGIYLTNPNEKCFITNKRLINSLPKKPNIDVLDSISIKFPIGSKHTCRILDYSHMSRIYICTVEQSLLKEKIFRSNDVKIGEMLNVTIESIKPEGLVVTSGHIKGFVPNLYISNVLYSDNIKKKFKEGQKVNARVLHTDGINLILTLKPSQIESEKCLKDLKEAQRGDHYPGVVVHTMDKGALVVFYNNVKGWIAKKYLGNIDTDDTDPTKYFYKGQVIDFWVLGVKGERVILSLKQPAEFKSVENLKIGQKIEGFVRKVHKDKVEIKNKKGMLVGVIPVNHLSCSLSLCSTFLNTFKVGDKINDVICINNNTKPSILSRRESLALKKSFKFQIKKFNELKVGYLIRCSYVSSNNSGIYVLPLIKDYTEKIFIKTQDIADKNTIIPKFKPYQSLVAKIVSIDHASKKIQLTSKFKEVFDNSVEAVINYFSQYLADVNYLNKFGKENDWSLCKYEPGEQVPCKVEQLGDEGGCLVHLPNEVSGLVATRLCPNVEPGKKIKGVFLCQDFKDSYVDICLKPDLCQKINNVQDGVINSSNLSSCMAENLLIKTDCVLAVLKKDCNRQLVYIPIYLHENDFEGTETHYRINKLKLCICGKVENSLIGFSKKLFLRLDKQRHQKIKEVKPLKNEIKELQDDVRENLNVKKVTQNGEIKKIKIDSSSSSSEEEIMNIDNENILDSDSDSGEDVENSSEEDNDDNNTIEDFDLEVYENSSSEEEKQINDNKDLIKNNLNVNKDGSPILSGVKSFFSSNSRDADESSSDEEEEQKTVTKKKKLSRAERAEMFRMEEERITKIEKDLADSTKSPENAAQFERLVVANPNSSQLWIQYISFHIAATEFEKARTVTKRALESIQMTMTEERQNIWIALLKLENMFGTKEIFDSTFEDAVRYNDPLTIYLETIQMLAEAGKFSEMEEKIRKARNKFKQHPKMWLEIAKTYYLVQKFKEARNIKEASLKSIQDKKSQMEIIIRFAIMEFKHGEEEQGAAIFETILSTDPRKVSVWNTYVDQLVKKNKIEQARKVLERAVSQKLPVKSMKSLFLKFRMFEEQHGSPQTVDMVKDSAKEYFMKVSKTF